MLIARRRIQLPGERHLEAGQVVTEAIWSSFRERTRRAMLSLNWVEVQEAVAGPVPASPPARKRGRPRKEKPSNA